MLIALRFWVLTSHLDLDLLARGDLLFLTRLLLAIMVISEVDLNAERIPDFVDTDTLRTHDAGNKLAADLELS